MSVSLSLSLHAKKKRRKKKEQTAAQSIAPTQQHHEVKQKKLRLACSSLLRGNHQASHTHKKIYPNGTDTKLTQTCSLQSSSITKSRGFLHGNGINREPHGVEPVVHVPGQRKKTQRCTQRAPRPLGQKTRDLARSDMQQNNGIDTSYSCF